MKASARSIRRMTLSGIGLERRSGPQRRLVPKSEYPIIEISYLMGRPQNEVDALIASGSLPVIGSSKTAIVRGSDVARHISDARKRELAAEEDEANMLTAKARGKNGYAY